MKGMCRGRGGQEGGWTWCLDIPSLPVLSVYSSLCFVFFLTVYDDT